MLETKIAELRKNKKVSQEELAEILNTSRQAISKWERGESYPDIEKLKDLAVFFNVSIDYILGYDLESNSVNEFLKRLENELKNHKFDVTLEEVETIVAKNKNNFDLHVACALYLCRLYSLKQDEKYSNLLHKYFEHAIAIHQPNNRYDVSVDDLKRYIASLYVSERKYDVARKYIKDNKLTDVDTILAICESKLKNYDEALKISSKTYIEALSKIIDSNVLQITLLMETERVEEAYDLSEWCISFIESIRKDDTLFLNAFVLVYFYKAVLEKILNKDNTEAVDFLRNNYKRALEIEDDSETLKYYYGEKIIYINIEKDIKKLLKEEIKTYNNKKWKNTLVSVYDEVFGGEE